MRTRGDLTRHLNSKTPTP